MTKVRVAICGGSGYTGSELLRILHYHPLVEVNVITSERFVNKDITDLFPHLYFYKGLKFQPLVKEKIINKADIFFMALPHAASQEAVHFFHKNGKKVIDLSADYRLKNPDVYEQWYGTKHIFHSTLKKAVYGLPELYRRKIKNSSLIANPGCYPTSAILALYPLFKNNLINTDRIIIDSKSGVSGAGRKSDTAYSFSELSHGFKAYSVTKHRHTPEIEQELSLLAKKKVNIDFTPHLLPVNRGILSTVYAEMEQKTEVTRNRTRNERRGIKDKGHKIDNIIRLYKKIYKNEPFIRILEKDRYPDIRNVRGNNICEIGIGINERTKTLIIVSAIDNLVKGASGQAVQNLNIMLGIEETTALNSLPVLP